MAAYISVPRDLTRVKAKVFMNLTKRQVICFGTAVLIGVPSFFSYKNHKLCLWANIARALIRKKEPPFAKIEAGNANRTTAKGGSSKWTKKVYHTPAGIANTI